MKQVVLKYVALVFGALLPSMLQAQVNPQNGYVITNQNDTIYGVIDYLSDKKCASECHFLPRGGTAYKTYLPGEIRGYRFADDGVFYVTKTFAVDGVKKTLFAEFLLQGGVSLFRYDEADNSYFFFVGEDGKVATIKNDGSFSRTVSDGYTKKELMQQKRNALSEVSQVFADSEKALHDLWTKNINTKSLTQITHDFDMEYCKSAGDCVKFRYDEKAVRNIAVKLLFKAGVSLGSNKLTKLNTIYTDVTMKTIVPEVGLGADITFPRFSKHFSLQALVSVSRWSLSETYGYYARYTQTISSSLKYWDLGFQIGPTYSFMPDSKFSPILRGGFVIDKPLSMKKSNLYYLLLTDPVLPATFCRGFYVGAGVDIAIRKHLLRLTAEYRRTPASNKEMTPSCLGLCAEFRL